MINQLQNNLNSLYEQYRENGLSENVLIKSLGFSIELIEIIEQLLSEE
jgi:hypothetical protein